MKRFPLYVALACGVGAAAALLSGCTPTQPSAPDPPSTTVTCSNTGSGSVCGIGNVITPPAPTTSPSPGGDNAVKGFAIFCYGFGAQPGQAEPNHDACVLPAGYPEIAVTASPKNAAGVDIPNPGDKTSADVIDWTLAVSPAGAASLVIQGDNRFNARVVPASARVAANFTLVATYRDPAGDVRTATKAGGIQ